MYPPDRGLSKGTRPRSGQSDSERTGREGVALAPQLASPLDTAAEPWYAVAQKTPTQGVWVWTEADGMIPETNQDALKRLNYIQGHLEGVRKMVQDEKYCVDILRQLFAVRRAVEKLEATLLDGHLHSCVIEGIQDGRQDDVIQELLELYTLASR